MPSWAKPTDPLSEPDLSVIMTNALPAYAYHVGREWTWTRSTGVWRLNMVFHEGGPAYVKARLDATPSVLQCSVRMTRHEVNALLRWLVLVDAIDHHPDDPTAAAKESTS